MVEIFASEPVREIVAGELLDSVLEHIAHDECHEKGTGKVTEPALECEGHDRSEHHGDTGGDAVINLTDGLPVLFLVEFDIEVAADVLLQHVVAIHEPTVPLRVVRSDRRISPCPLVIRLLADKLLHGCRSGTCPLVAAEPSERLQKPKRKALCQATHVFVAEIVQVL